MKSPTGISGQALAGRAYLQAQKFGATMVVARSLESIECGKPMHRLLLDGGDRIRTRTVVISTGVLYRHPAIDRLDEFTQVHYGASHVEGQLCFGKDVAIIGGGNSAGQTAVYPCTDFIKDELALDECGFIMTGERLGAASLAQWSWPLERAPYLYETSCPRIFAAGDVRSGSIKRVASAVGEGSVCVQFIHRVLADAQQV